MITSKALCVPNLLWQSNFPVLLKLKNPLTIGLLQLGTRFCSFCLCLRKFWVHSNKLNINCFFEPCFTVLGLMQQLECLLAQTSAFSNIMQCIKHKKYSDYGSSYDIFSSSKIYCNPIIWFTYYWSRLELLITTWTTFLSSV